MSLYDPCLCVCRQLLAFNPAVHRTASGEGEMYDIFLLLWISQGTGPRWAQLHDLAPDLNDVMELWAIGPHAIFVKMIYTLGSRRTFQSDLALCGLHEFLRLNVADFHEGISEKVSGTVSASAFLLDMTVMSSSGVIVSPSNVPVGQLQPRTTAVSCTDAGSMVTPPPDIEQP